jgi:hypothetical protein
MSSEEGPSESDPDIVEEQDSIGIVYDESDRYFKFPASGVRGGVQSRGDFKMEFFVESLGDPEGERYEIAEDGSIGEITERGEVPLVREKQAAAILPQSVALSTAGWILSSLFDRPTEEVREIFEENFEIAETDTATETKNSS